LTADGDGESKQMWRPTILLVDDHTLVLDALKKLLEPEFEIIGTVSDSHAALPAALELKPDIIILDLGMPQVNGLQTGPELKKHLPRTKLIVLTMNEDSEVARESLRLWASGYLLKKSAGSELVKAIREALRGRSYVTPLTERQLQEQFIRDPEFDHAKSLTPRQREVLKLLAEGKTMKEVATELNVTPRTVAFHKYKIMEEFGLRNNSDLVKLALHEKVL
jgi:DNA-binding NarL/FixJ family response regulator